MDNWTQQSKKSDALVKIREGIFLTIIVLIVIILSPMVILFFSIEAILVLFGKSLLDIIFKTEPEENDNYYSSI